MSALVFLDIETTGRDPREDVIWEFAAIRREESGAEHEYHCFVRHAEELREAMPERFRADLEARYDDAAALTWHDFAALAWSATTGARIVGACPWFDAAFLETYLRTEDFTPEWSHRLVDVEALAAGYRGHLFDGLSAAARDLRTPLGDHTAMGDTRAARAIYDVVMAERHEVQR